MSANYRDNVFARQEWRAKRDQMVCVCGHRNVSHGYGEDAEPVGPWNTLIGQGDCGMDGCACPAFEARDGDQ